jgi:hypothetical protein
VADAQAVSYRAVELEEWGVDVRGAFLQLAAALSAEMARDREPDFWEEVASERGSVEEEGAWGDGQLLGVGEEEGPAEWRRTRSGEWVRGEAMAEGSDSD